MDSVKGMSKIEQLRYQTYLEAKELLDCYGKACIVRPTGFGKTGILTRIINDYVIGAVNRKIKVIYLYPNEPVKNAVLRFYYKSRGLEIPKDKHISGVEFWTYTKLSRMQKTEEMKGYDSVRVFIADECHKLGGNKISKALRNFMDMYPDVKYVGATATPDRMDLFDEVREFFDDRVVSPYTLHDAFKDGILQKPCYCYCSYGLAEDISDIKKRVRKETVGITDKKLLEETNNALKSRLVEISELYNMSSVIRDVCKQYIKNTSYMKGVIFFSNYEHINNKEKTVVNWFRDAFPNHNIRVMRVTGQNKEYRKNAERIESLTPRKNTIDLITSVDMINMGYHVGDLKFIGMYRGTESGTIFAQQLGRVLDSGSLESGVVFDWVDNLHRESLYDVLGKESYTTISGRNRYFSLKQKILEQGISENDTTVLDGDELKEYKTLKRRFDRKPVDESIDTRWWHNNPNALEPEDLVATNHKATYTELIAKTVAEPIAMRCRQVYKNWLDAGGDVGDGTPAYICKHAKLPAIPLGPFCFSKRLTVEKVLSVIFGEGDYKEMAEEHTRLCKEQGMF